MSSEGREYLEQLEQLGPAGQWALERIIFLTLENLRLKQELERARASIKQLDERLEQLHQQAHRQAAPFRRAEEQRNAHPARAGRKAGHPGSFRPRPAQIDEHLHVPLDGCPHCGGPVCDKVPLIQYIEEIPVVRPRVTELVTEEGWCAGCQQQVYSTHPLQSGRATGAAAVQLGPRALALACDLNKAKGLSMRRTVGILEEHFGLKITAGGLAQLVQRVGRKVQPSYEQMAVELRQSAVVHADETSWWVGGPGWWLWVFATAKMTFYVVIRSRAASVAMGVLGENFAGVLVSDCLAIYDDLNPLQHKCYSHHLKAVSEALEMVAGGAEDYLRQVQALLRTAILLKALQGPTPDQRFVLCVNTLKERAHSLLDSPRAAVVEEKVRLRLWKQRDHLFTFLDHAQVPATNNLAERQLRPAVIARKISCGNKTEKGALAWAVLASVAATCRQRGHSFIETIRLSVLLHPALGP
jgi:transposase-like protein